MKFTTNRGAPPRIKAKYLKKMTRFLGLT